MSPASFGLSDDNGDGLITWEDTPDIVIISDDGGLIPNKHGVLRILSGADGSEMMSVNRSDYGTTQVYAYRYGNVALGDIDNDGLPDIVTLADVVAGSPPHNLQKIPLLQIPVNHHRHLHNLAPNEECNEEEEEEIPEPSDNPICLLHLPQPYSRTGRLWY